MPKQTKLFVAGATGVVGTELVRQAAAREIDVVAHLRPATAQRGHAVQQLATSTSVCDLSDTEAVKQAMADCTAVLQLIGTMRKRFHTGDTYETSDIGTTRQLVDAAIAQNVSRTWSCSAVLAQAIRWARTSKPRRVLRPLLPSSTAHCPSSGQAVLRAVRTNHHPRWLRRWSFSARWGCATLRPSTSQFRCLYLLRHCCTWRCRILLQTRASTKRKLFGRRCTQPANRCSSLLPVATG